MLLLQALLAAALSNGFRFFNDDTFRDEKLEALQDRLLDLNEQAQSIQAAADAEKRDLSDDESRSLDAIFAEFEHIEAEIGRRNRINAQSNKLRQSMGRQTEPQDPQPQNRAPSGQPQAQSGQHRSHPRAQVIERPEERGRWGWRNLGEFASAVRASRGGNIDPRLMQNAPTSFGSESSGADGGFLVPPDFRQAIITKVMGEESLLARTDQMTSSSNTLTMPKDEATPWGTSGMQAYWESEGGQIGQSKPSLGESTIKLNKLSALVPVTEELMEDAPALDTYLRRRVPEVFDFKIQDAIIAGSGVGTPLGILNAGCLVSVAKESSQTADTINYKNLVKMWSRMYGPCRSRAVWLINQDIEPQLLQLSFEGTSSSVPAYLPANGLAGSPYATLFGRPVIPVQSCKTLGDLGDIILADLSQYMTVTKTAGIRSDVSMHLFFDYDMAAYRFIMRIGGQPWWAEAVTPKNSNNTLGCFVALAERG
ncbi:MAG: phage major capsid protein [Porticoccaceae bacterium]|nr:phage major capsid protein [Porticoccaceae bacterium]